jgi:hypothetical protein
VSAFARYRRDLTVGIPWILGQGRYLSITVTTEPGGSHGTVFEEANGTRYFFEAFQSREEAQSSGEGRVFAVRPDWSHPAKEWFSADPDFWRGHPGNGVSA